MTQDANQDAAQPLVEVTSGANRDQAQAWNGEDGMHLVEQQERREVMFQSLRPQLLQAAGVSP